jgi:hypothetical protein
VTSQKLVVVTFYLGVALVVVGIGLILLGTVGDVEISIAKQTIKTCRAQ